MPTVKKTTKSSLKTEEKVVKTKPHSAEASLGNNSFAIIETGGKQYRVAVGDSIKIEKISAKGGPASGWKEGDLLTFDKVLLVNDGKDSTDIGTPYVSGAKVSGTITKIGRHPKITVIKYKQKSRYFKKNGHRQPYFKVKIDKIL